jgi:predicted SnoaL-like aldol condensation-catalyzing enzyme
MDLPHSGRRLANASSLYLEAIRDGDYVEAINAYAGARYTQHSTPVKDGKDGFIEFFAEFVERNPVRDIEIIRAFEDGRYVFLQVVQTLNHGEFRYVTADIFDTDDDGKLIEHWDIIEELADGATAVDARTQIDGPTDVTDLAATDANKQLVTRFVGDVLITGAFDRLGEFMAPAVAQHRTGLADGIESLQTFATETGLRYIEAHRIVGAGNVVAVLAETELDGTRHAVIDLYRLAAGTIVEHWDVSEEITPEETWVNSGKF